MSENLEQHCKHVYEYVHADICPLCGKFTHETDWDLLHEQHREWIASGKSVSQGWWSI